MRIILQEDMDFITTILNRTKTIKITFDEVHGFLSAIVCCPKILKPSEWFDYFLNYTNSSSNFKSKDELKEFMDKITDIYANILKNILKDKFDPYIGTFNIEEYNQNDPVPWCKGFSAGMVMWDYDFEMHKDSEFINYLIPVFYFMDKDKLLKNDLLRSPVDKKDIEEMIENMVYYIGPSTILLYEYFHKSDNKIENNKSEKIGRNELCPCGSGLKYKKCCGK